MQSVNAATVPSRPPFPVKYVFRRNQRRLPDKDITQVIDLIAAAAAAAVDKEREKENALSLFLAKLRSKRNLTTVE